MKRTLAVKTGGGIGEDVKLAGWVHTRRDHGQIIFIDLRDKTGIVQLVFLPENPVLYKLANNLRSEWVVEITGKVKERPGKMVNEKIATGKVEIEVKELKILNEAKTPPFEISSDIFPLSQKEEDKEKKELTKKKTVSEEVRLKYRYLDLRHLRMQRNLRLRHKMIKIIRDYMDRKGYIEIETPILTKSTPEGARDFLVPSRLHHGQFYALPQAPQQLKQLVMVAGFEKYFQIARCFRDEDLRGDRQPEFTQLDIEMSFPSQKKILRLVEKLFIKIVRQLVLLDKNLSKTLTFNPFLVVDYQEAIKKYGTDKPDLRKDKNNKNELAFVWIVNWPLFEWDKDKKKYDPHHHIFTAPKNKDIPLLEKEPLKVRSWQHDLVLNGHEIGGGSIRIHRRDIQEKIFKLVGLTEEEINKKFGHLLKAFGYGAPPHGGIAIGIDRFLMVLLSEESIREVIAFPKSGDGRDLTMKAPSSVEQEQLKDLGIKVDL